MLLITKSLLMTYSNFLKLSAKVYFENKLKVEHIEVNQV